MAARGRLLTAAAAATTTTWTRRTYAGRATDGCKAEDKDAWAKFEESFKIKTDLKKLLDVYRETDFEKTLTGAPRHAFWTAVVSAVPLVTKTLVVLVTLEFDGDYPSVVAEYVSLYVAAANTWWWSVGGVDHKNSSSSSFDTPFWRLQRVLAPTTVCAVAVAFLSPFVGLTAIVYASFRTVHRLVADDGPTGQPWCRSLVMLVYGVCVPCLATALICAAFN